MAEDSAMKRIGIMLLQLLVTAAGIWYVFHDPQKRAQIADALRQADRNWVIPRLALLQRGRNARDFGIAHGVADARLISIQIANSKQAGNSVVFPIFDAVNLGSSADGIM
jgi:hypothetical protein